MAEITLFISQDKLDRWRRAAHKRGYRYVSDWAATRLQEAAIAATPEDDDFPICEICGGRGIMHRSHSQ